MAKPEAGAPHLGRPHFARADRLCLIKQRRANRIQTARPPARSPRRRRNTSTSSWLFAGAGMVIGPAASMIGACSKRTYSGVRRRKPRLTEPPRGPIRSRISSRSSASGAIVKALPGRSFPGRSFFGPVTGWEGEPKTTIDGGGPDRKPLSKGLSSDQEGGRGRKTKRPSDFRRRAIERDFLLFDCAELRSARIRPREHRVAA
jgi:hypothetical protein